MGETSYGERVKGGLAMCPVRYRQLGALGARLAPSLSFIRSRLLRLESTPHLIDNLLLHGSPPAAIHTRLGPGLGPGSSSSGRILAFEAPPQPFKALIAILRSDAHKPTRDPPPRKQPWKKVVSPRIPYDPAHHGPE